MTRGGILILAATMMAVGVAALPLSAQRSQTADFFAAQGAVPEIGKLFGPEEHQAVAVISDKLWRTKFSADTAILSRSITMGQTKVPIIGVTTPAFRGTEPSVDMDAFFPLATVRDLSGSA